MYEESVVELQKANILPEINTIRFAGLGRAYARAGRKKEAIRILEQLKALSKQRYVEPTGLAMIYAGLGDKDQAFVWLEKAFDERSIGVPAIKVDARYDSLRSDPRFQDLLRRMGLPP